MDENKQEVHIHFVAWNERYDESLTYTSARTEEWHSGIKTAHNILGALKEPLQARTITSSTGEMLQQGDGGCPR